MCAGMLRTNVQEHEIGIFMPADFKSPFFRIKFKIIICNFPHLVFEDKRPISVALAGYSFLRGWPFQDFGMRIRRRSG